MKTFLSPRIRMGVVVATTAVLLAGCKQMGQQVQQKAQEVVTQAQTALLTESELSGIKDPLVRKNFVAQANVHAYRVVTSSSGKSEGTTTSEIEISGTNVKFHAIMQVGGKTQEMIVIGNTTYVKDPTENVWWKQVASSDESKKGPDTSFKAPSLSDIKEDFVKKQENTEFKQLGTESCGTLTCYKYQELDKEENESRVFWFDNKEFLLRKDEQTFGGITSTGVYSYDNIVISVPSPTKDVPEGHSAFEYMMGAQVSAPTSGTPAVPTKAQIDAMMKKAQEGK